MTRDEENRAILSAQAGDEQAENDVLALYAPLAKSISRSFRLLGKGDADDLAQVGMIGLMRAIRSYRTDGEASFKTYASHCIRNTILDSLRKAGSEPAPLNEEEITDKLDPENLYLESEAFRLLSDAIRSTLSGEELEVLSLYLDAMSYEDISRKLGITRKKVDNTLYALRKKIKKLLNENQ